MKHSKSGLFLMELVIAILFFSLAGTVCIQLFVRAHLLSARTTDENHAALHAQNLAECWIASDGDLERVAALFPEGSYSPDSASLSLYFDKDWNSCRETAARHTARLTAQPADEGNNVTARISVWSQAARDEDSQAVSSAQPQELYSLSLSHHIPKRRGSNAE